MDRDHYPTPAWVTDVLCDHFDVRGKRIWEPACGSGKMVAALEQCDAEVFSSDIADGPDQDFMKLKAPRGCWGIITNPPYGQQGRIAEAFIERALYLDTPFIAMLLSVDFDSGSSRTHLFGDCPQFAGKIVLLKRITWFTPRHIKGEKKPAGPSQNHAWYIWQHGNKAEPVIRYGP